MYYICTCTYIHVVKFISHITPSRRQLNRKTLDSALMVAAVLRWMEELLRDKSIFSAAGSLFPRIRWRRSLYSNSKVVAFAVISPQTCANLSHLSSFIFLLDGAAPAAEERTSPTKVAMSMITGGATLLFLSSSSLSMVRSIAPDASGPDKSRFV